MKRNTYAMLCDDKDREQSYTTANQETPKIAGKWQERRGKEGLSPEGTFQRSCGKELRLYLYLSFVSFLLVLIGIKLFWSPPHRYDFTFSSPLPTLTIELVMPLSSLYNLLMFLGFCHFFYRSAIVFVSLQDLGEQEPFDFSLYS